MNEPGFPPPKPSSGRDLERERAAQEEYYRLEEAGSLPVGEDGQPMGLIKFMEQVEAAADSAEDGVSIKEVMDNFGKPSLETDAEDKSISGRSERDKERQRRGRGGSVETTNTFTETPRENRDALRDAVAQFENVAAQSPAEAERAAVQAAESAYLTAYKQLEQKRTIWNRLSNGKDLKEESEKVEALKRSYDEKRIVYAEALTRSAKERLDAKGANASRKDVVAERYNRIVRFNEVVKPAAEKRIAARKEALDARGRGVFEKTLAWSARQNQQLEKRLGKTGAIAARTLIGAVGVSGLAALAGGFGAVALTGAGIFGAHKFARGFIGAYAGKLGGDMAGAFYEQRIGRVAQQAAKESLKTQGRGEELSIEMLASLDSLREKLASRAEDATVLKKKALVQALIAFGIGAGTAAALSEVFAVQEAADKTLGAAVGTPDATPASVSESAPVSSEGASTTPAAETPSTLTPETSTAESVLAEAVIDKGEGFNQLFVDLRASGLSGDFSVVQHLNDPSISPSQLSQEIGALIGEKSGVTHVGDRLFVNGEGSLVFERDGVQQVLMESKGELVAKQPLTGIELRGTPVVVPDVSVAEAAQTQVPDPVIINDVPDAGVVESDATVGRSLQDFSGPMEATEPTQPAPAEVVGRSLDQFGANQDAAAAEASSRHTGVVGRSLEEFAPKADTETFTNAYGVEVNPQEPAAYAWKVPGTDTTITMASGGTPEAEAAFAHAYADTHPGSSVHFVTPVFEDGVVKYRVDAWDSVEGVPAQLLTDVVSGPSGVPYAGVSAEAFTRKLP